MKKLYVLLSVSGFLCAQHVTQDGKKFYVYDNPATERMNLAIEYAGQRYLVQLPEEKDDKELDPSKFLWAAPDANNIYMVVKSKRENSSYGYHVDCTDLSKINQETATKCFILGSPVSQVTVGDFSDFDKLFKASSNKRLSDMEVQCIIGSMMVQGGTKRAGNYQESGSGWQAGGCELKGDNDINAFLNVLRGLNK